MKRCISETHVNNRVVLCVRSSERQWQWCWWRPVCDKFTDTFGRRSRSRSPRGVHYKQKYAPSIGERGDCVPHSFNCTPCTVWRVCALLTHLFITLLVILRENCCSSRYETYRIARYATEIVSFILGQIGPKSRSLGQTSAKKAAFGSVVSWNFTLSYKLYVTRDL